MEPEYREWLIEFGDSGYVALYRVETEIIAILAVRHQRVSRILIFFLSLKTFNPFSDSVVAELLAESVLAGICREHSRHF